MALVHWYGCTINMGGPGREFQTQTQYQIKWTQTRDKLLPVSAEIDSFLDRHAPNTVL